MNFNHATLGGSYMISQGGGNGTAFIVSIWTLVLTNGPAPAGRVSVATNIFTAGLFNATLDNSAGPVNWSLNMRFARTGGMAHKSMSSLRASASSFFVRGLQEGIGLRHLRARLAQTKTQLAEQSLTLAHL
jgi:hypothetical protein